MIYETSCDGNGRTSRFISSYLLSKNMNILSGYRLAYTIKDNINQYYKAFKIVNEEKNKGDLTPFVIIFLDIIIKEFNSLCQSLEEKSELMEYYKNIAVKLGNEKENEINIVFILFQQTLFGNMGIGVEELVKESGESEYKVRQVIGKLENKFLNKEKFGKKFLYSFNLDAVGEYIENN